MKKHYIFGFLLTTTGSLALAEDNGGEPDLTNEVMTDSVLGGFPTTGGIQFLSYGASSMQTIRNGTTTFDYAGGGCISNTTATTLFIDENITIPDGSILVSVGGFYNNSGNDAGDVEIYNFDGLGAFATNAFVSTPAAGGGSASAGAYLWDTTTAGESYVVRWNVEATPSGNPCMIRVGYIPPEYAAETVFAHKFEY
ncbi:hypothetical protein [Marinicella meishanensis]|uniref:hypothetical protein n=1 Tax=Marinicella meishanensis TaxID=2873263 RepID=UPI001CC14912|nr:hypothetical protein [Marinicella sp. NBU2979]